MRNFSQLIRAPRLQPQRVSSSFWAVDLRALLGKDRRLLHEAAYAGPAELSVRQGVMLLCLTGQCPFGFPRSAGNRIERFFGPEADVLPVAECAVACRETSRLRGHARPWLYSAGDKSRLYGVFFGNERLGLQITLGVENWMTVAVPSMLSRARFAYSLVWRRRDAITPQTFPNSDSASLTSGQQGRRKDEYL